MVELDMRHYIPKLTCQLAGDGMVPFRLGGLVRNSLWSVVVSASPLPSSTTSPAGQSAYRVVSDINSTTVSI